MPGPRPTYRRLSESVRHRLEVATAMAWEALVDAHVEQALEFMALFQDRLDLEECIDRYAREMDLPETMASTVRTRVLVTVEGAESARPEDSLPIRSEDD